MSSPTQRSLALLRERGYVPWVTERVIPYANKKIDLFSFGDILALGPRNSAGRREVLIVQTTDGTNASKRVAKIKESEHIAAVREAGIRVVVHGWRKSARTGRYVCREVDLS